jgi:hypothetical protein
LSASIEMFKRRRRVIYDLQLAKAGRDLRIVRDNGAADRSKGPILIAVLVRV